MTGRLSLAGALVVAIPAVAAAECISTRGRHELAELKVRSCRDALPLLAERMASGSCETYFGVELQMRADRPDLLEALREGHPYGWAWEIGPRFVLDAEVLGRAQVDTLAGTASSVGPRWAHGGFVAEELAGPTNADLFVVRSCEDFEGGESFFVEILHHCSCIGCDLNTGALIGPQVVRASLELLEIASGQGKLAETSSASGGSTAGSGRP